MKSTKQPTHFIEVYRFFESTHISEPQSLNLLGDSLKSTIRYFGKTIAIFKIYPKAVTILLLFISSLAFSQPVLQAKAGMNTRLMPALTVDAGVNFGGPVLATTYSWQSFQSAGIYAGYRLPMWSIYAGYGWQDDKGKEMLKGKPYIAGISWHDDRGQGMLDLRWMAGAVQFTMGWNLSR